MGPAAEPERKHWQTAFWFAEDAPGLISHYFAFRDVLLEFYRQHGEKPGMSEEEFLRACDISHAIYFSHSCLQAVEWFFYPMLLQPLWPTQPRR